jgi:hypothetical protein
VLAHCLGESLEFASENIESPADYIFGSENTGGLDCKNELFLSFTDLDSSLETLSLGKSDALYTKNASICILNLNSVSHLIELVD